ncbi:MAG: TetR/AcrR family transcriptional regulator [Polyangiaceae bacterium]|nr:TetR/AcrR family transcriptional regulator [Myxococcales bacterium]MCB9590621.1 TetR/AcrR family transcriptional regulator [Polyangiaceae bacterium]MCB9608113.1 TetR/AcrR family transcriptional regulator [Polyangiaceae bacterium]
MPRPPEPEKRRELARRAVKVLQHEGMDVSTSRLAEALETKRPTLLYHFPNRADIAETALEDLLSEQMLFVMQRIECHQHPIDRLYAQVKAVHAFHHGNEQRIVFLSQAIATTGSARMSQIMEVGNRVFEAQRVATAERLREGMRKGAVADCDPEALVALVRAVIDGLMVQRVMTGLELEPVHETLWERLLKPLKLREWEES